MGSNKGAKLWDLVPTEEDYRILRRRVHPMDTIFHEYAVALFDLRYKAFKAGARRSDCMPRLSNSDDQLRQLRREGSRMSGTDNRGLPRRGLEVAAVIERGAFLGCN